MFNNMYKMVCSAKFRVVQPDRESFSYNGILILI